MGRATVEHLNNPRGEHRHNVTIVEITKRSYPGDARGWQVVAVADRENAGVPHWCDFIAVPHQVHVIKGVVDVQLCGDPPNNGVGYA